MFPERSYFTAGPSHVGSPQAGRLTAWLAVLAGDGTTKLHCSFLLRQLLHGASSLHLTLLVLHRVHPLRDFFDPNCVILSATTLQGRRKTTFGRAVPNALRARGQCICSKFCCLSDTSHGVAERVSAVSTFLGVFTH